ncbi:hypothetical protein BDV40DRAFT_91922 [Aspergillus tamarii]|uniref:Tetrapyrrole methylase domain-containing protein n=1 Tax=Aspergillus tamarii TaxID=41984 RepID=A0A5N6UC03_ASPTM|nr:hypothetical protein BDV40DRAFT_91922 [Aspergillus tamarii]
MPEGNLIIIGSGLKCIVQFTLEAIAALERADKVFYCVADPATEGFIKEKNKSAVDLYQYYANGRLRYETYILMAEVIMEAVRAGQSVVGVFYGHAGNFVSPSRRAIAIAKSEGYSAKMLPGISAEDCLFADLLIDPSYPGAQTVEATDLLIRSRPILTSSHVIIYQVGVLGQLGFEFGGIKNDKFNHLVQRLLQEYGEGHPVINYKAAISPFSSPTIQRYIISELSNPEVQKTVDACSTFYIPPKALLPISDTATLVSLDKSGSVPLSPPLWWDPLNTSAPTLYGPKEAEVISNEGNHSPPEGYRRYSASPAMQKTVEQLVLDPNALEVYKRSPEVYTTSVHGLEPHEAKALASAKEGTIFSTMHEGLSDSGDTPTVVVVIVILGNHPP